LNGDCGIVSIRGRSECFAALPCHVAAVVAEGLGKDGNGQHLNGSPKTYGKRLSNLLSANYFLRRHTRPVKFAQYGLAASDEALRDARWQPTRAEDLEATVRLRMLCRLSWADRYKGICLGSRIGNLEGLYGSLHNRCMLKVAIFLSGPLG
jgi:hypothetical protein